MNQSVNQCLTQIKNALHHAHTKTLHSICSGVSEGENEVAGRIRFLAKFKQPKAIALGAIVLAVACVAVFCLGGNNPITTVQSALDVVPSNTENNTENGTTTSSDTSTTSQATEGTAQTNTQTGAQTDTAQTSPWDEAALLELIQENYTTVLPDGEISACADASYYEGIVPTELICFTSEHYAYLFSAETSMIQAVLLEDEAYVDGADNAITTAEQAVDAATIFLQTFCLQDVSTENATCTVETLGSDNYSITLLWVTEAGIHTGERASIILRTDGTLVSFIYNTTEPLADGLDITNMISEQEAIAFAYAALEDVKPDATHEIEAYQQIEDGTVLWKLTIAKIANPELDPELGGVYTQTVWVSVDAFTGEVTQIYYSR